MDPFGRYELPLSSSSITPGNGTSSSDQKQKQKPKPKQKPGNSLDALLGPTKKSPTPEPTSSSATPGPSSSSSSSASPHTQTETPPTDPEPESAILTRQKLHKGDLQNYLRLLVSALNSRDYILWRDAFDKNFRAVLPPFKLTSDEYISHLEMVGRLRPNAEIVILGMDEVLDEGRGLGRVWMEFEIHGVLGAGLVRQSVACVKFKLNEDGKWRVLRYEASDNLKGMSGFDF